MLTEEAIDIVRQFNLLVDYEDAIRFIMNYIDENDYIINCAYDATALKGTFSIFNSGYENSSKI